MGPCFEGGFFNGVMRFRIRDPYEGSEDLNKGPLNQVIAKNKPVGLI